LGVYVEERRSSTFEAEGKAVGPSDSGSRIQLGDVAIAEFAVAGGGVLFLGDRDADAGGMFQREFDSLVERDRFGEQGSGQKDEPRQ
jgi:hypothetical protein